MKTVDRGAALLDEKLPGWDKKIDLEVLDLGNTCNCVVGQLHRRRGLRTHDRYWHGIAELGGDVYISPQSYGFTTGYASFPSLTRAWRTLILKRRA